VRIQLIDWTYPCNPMKKLLNLEPYQALSHAEDLVPLQKIPSAQDFPQGYTSILSCATLIQLFDELFLPTLGTRLCGGSDEPIYLPASETSGANEIHFTRDYCASALHEIAHWCVAGAERLKHIDFGYWYAPDGRSAEQQDEFERVEVKPQALEWIFSVACGARFNVSADNLAQGLGASALFKQAIVDQAHYYCQNGLPLRAKNWVETLAACFQVPDPLNLYHYQREFLDK
jgi:elongation factor P hydroxylase